MKKRFDGRPDAVPYPQLAAMCVSRSFKPTESLERAGFVWLWASGVPVRDIAVRSRTSVTTVYRWIRRWQREGHVNTRLRSGRPPVHVSNLWQGNLSLPEDKFVPYVTSPCSMLCRSFPPATNRSSTALPSVQTAAQVCLTPHCTHQRSLKILPLGCKDLTNVNSQAIRTTRELACTFGSHLHQTSQ